jgi:hypothetical protein
MTGQAQREAVRRRTPSDASEFEREQLRFLLSEGDVAGTLATINPSLAWLPDLRKMNLIQADSSLSDWIERNFADFEAVREVVANLHLFTPDIAGLLEFRLYHGQQAASLPPLLQQCWRLIIRHIKTWRGPLQNEWFEIAPQVKRGDHSTALLDRLAEVLRPHLRISKRLSLTEIPGEVPRQPSDLMRIDYEVWDNLPAEEVLDSWPKDASADIDNRLLLELTSALSATLADAIEVGIEHNERYSTSDTDVPSVAQHPQNTYRSGFQVIVRVVAEIWLRLTRKASALALSIVKGWTASDYRLVRRLALFASADSVVPANFAADLLITLPQGELFLTNSSVETYRLIRARWNDFAPEKRESILRRISQGPPPRWFRKDAEIDKLIDRNRFDFLGAMKRDGFVLNSEATRLLSEIHDRWPTWELRPAEQTGFHIWHESGPRRITGDADKLRDVSDDHLVAAARRVAETADFLDGDAWQAICLSDPDRALRALAVIAARSDWPAEFWEQLLWSRKEYAGSDTEGRIAQLLLRWPATTFVSIASAASSWLGEHVKTLDDTLLWPLWDRIAETVLIESGADNNE